MNGGAWQQTSTATVALGSTVNLGPQQLTGGIYSWTGHRRLLGQHAGCERRSPRSGTNVYTLTYTNTYGAQSQQSFTITAN